MTLVEFRLHAKNSGTELTIAESGFDQLPPGRRDEAYEANKEGWNAIAGLLQKHLQLVEP